MVRQISVFIDNTSGQLAAFTRLLEEKKIDLISLTIADTAHFGILRFIVRDAHKALDAIQEAGYTAKINHVLAVEAPDRPGGLAEILQILSDGGVGVEYLYSFMRNAGGQALIIVRADDGEKAEKTLIERGVRLLTQEEVEEL